MPTSNHVKFEIYNGYFGTGTFKVILMAAGFTFDIDAHANLSDVSANELAAGNGYTTGGQTLAGVNVTEDNTNDRVRVTWNDITWTASGGSIGPSPGVIEYKDSGVAATSTIVSYTDFSGNKTVTDGGNLVVTNINMDGNHVA